MNRQITWKDARRYILGSANWIVHLDEDDLNTFEGQDGNILVLESSTKDSSEKRFSILSKMIAECVADKNLTHINKIIIFIQFPISNPITMNEMSAANQLVDALIPEGNDCEVKWGLSPQEDDALRIVCAMKKRYN